MALKVALLGAGRMGQLHYRTLKKMPHVQLCHIYDPFLQKSHEQIFDKKFFTSDINSILQDKSIDACIIATPSTTHAELIRACVRHGKHIFCEKPVSFDKSVLIDLKNIVEQSGIKLQIGFNRRFDPGFRKIKNELANGAIGALHLIKITNRDPKRPDLNFVKDSGGLFFDFNIHDFDALHYLTGLTITEVFAQGDALIQPELKAYGDIDTAIISLKLSNQSMAIIDCSRETGYGYDQRLELFGDNGMLSLPNLTTTSVQTMKTEGQQSDQIPYSFVERFSESYCNELEAFFTSIRDNKNPSPNLNDAIKALCVAEAAQISLKENRSVAL